MPNKTKNVNTGRKHQVLRDELGIKGAGVYAFTPFDNVDQSRRTLIKIGESSDLNRRTENYMTYFPQGVYMLAFLTEIKGKRKTRADKGFTPKQQRKNIEDYLTEYISTHDRGKRVYSSARVRRPNSELEGRTEWVFSRVENVHDAFQSASREFNANVHLFYLQGKNVEGKLEDVLKETIKSIKQPKFQGVINFSIKNESHADST